MVKTWIATRVAAEMRKEPGVEVVMERGSMGELSVMVDGREVVRSSRFGYPNPWKVMRLAREAVRDPTLPA